MSSRTLAAILALLSMGYGAAQTAVSDKPETPFKLATYEVRVGLVLGETILDIGAGTSPSFARELPPSRFRPMRALIESYDRVKPRPYQMANFFNGQKGNTDGLAFAKDSSSVKTAIGMRSSTGFFT